MTRMNALAAQDLAAIRAGLPASDAAFESRLGEHFPVLHDLFGRLYGERDDALEHLTSVVEVAKSAWAERPDALKAHDVARQADPDWYQSNRMLGGVLYVDRYAGDLRSVHERIPYFVELGLTYLHLMPIFSAPDGESDGGYAVSSYRAIDPAVGTVDDLRALAAALRANGISLVLDFVFNHTSNEHEWARRAVAGDPQYRDFYLIFPDRTMPDAYESTVREIFPDDHPGSFVQLPDGRWIWATFHRFQWDLDYSNPAVFRAMADELLFIANLGVDILRMDAVAFIWKQLGTSCESLPEAHLLLRAFNAVVRMAAPAVLFKSEAIVHPDQVGQYISLEECQLSYNPLQMALTWEALATRDPRMLSLALERRHDIPAGCSWVTYVRGHDDVGWTFADEEAAELGIDGYQHRRFLNAFYANRFPGSFARGVPFQENVRTGDARVAGTTASLAGIEAGDPNGVARVLLAHAIAFSTGGIPLIYLGDEVAQLGDDSYLLDPALMDDSRWVNRPRYPRAAYAARDDASTASGQVFHGMRRLISARRAAPELAHGRLLPFEPHAVHVLGYQRPGNASTVLVLANFGDETAHVDALTLSGFLPAARELITDREVSLARGIALDPLQIVWLRVTAVAATSAATPDVVSWFG